MLIVPEVGVEGYVLKPFKELVRDFIVVEDGIVGEGQHDVWVHGADRG